jgi:hypothetical protein
MFQVTNQGDDSDTAIENPVEYGGFGSPQNEFADVVQYLNDADLANGAYGTAPDLDDTQNVVSYLVMPGPAALACRCLCRETPKNLLLHCRRSSARS